MTRETALAGGWYHGWNIVAVCVLAQIVANGLPISAFSLFLAGWSVELHTPISTLQLGLAACGLGTAFLAPIAGILADRYPARLLLGAGLSGMAALCVAISFVASTRQYLVLYAALLPISVALSTSVPANAVVSRWFARRLGLALGLTALGLGLAGVIMPPLVAGLLPVLGWRIIWRSAGVVIALTVLPLVLAVVRDRPSAAEGKDYTDCDAAPTVMSLHGKPGHGGALRWRDVMLRRNFWLLVATYLPMLALYGGCGQNLVPLAISRDLTQHTAGLLLSAFSVAQLAATLLGGLLSDRFGNRLPFTGLAFAAACGGAIVAYGHSVFAIGLGAMLVGAGGGFWPLLAASLAVEFGANGAGRAFGLALFFLPLAVLAPFAVAKTQESGGSYATALLVMAALSAVGGALCLLMRERPILPEFAKAI